MLVIMENGDIQLLLEPALDFKAAGGGDVLKVDAAEGGGDQLHRADDLLGVGGVQADGEGIHPAEGLEEDSLALHHRQRGLRTDIPEAEYRRAVGDDGDQVALGRIGIDLAFIRMDFAAGLGHARGIGGREVIPVFKGHLAGNGNLALVPGMQRERPFIIVHRLCSSFLLTGCDRVHPKINMPSASRRQAREADGGSFP